jgi:acyl-CoA thioesterase-2
MTATNGPLQALLDIRPIDDDVYEAPVSTDGPPRLFGGLVAAQALLAAAKTVDAQRPAHSLHGYFILPGRPGVPIAYHVDRTRDGRSFSTRHVTARQDGVAIFELLASFQAPEPGIDFQADPPEIGPVPDALAEPFFPMAFARQLDVRPLAPPAEDGGWRIHPYWVKTSEPIGDDPVLNIVVLTFISDLALMAGARAPGTWVPMAAAASVDHAVWFHRVPSVDDWLLFSTETVANIGTRGLVRGSMHTADGTLVATVTQEALLRPLEG